MLIHWFRTSTQFPVGTVIVAHGYAEHHGRFLPLIQGLVNRGFDVAAYDHEGHGTSPGKRANVDVGHLILDHLEHRRSIVEESRSDNIFLFGHSMGGLITAASALIEPRPLNGIVLSGPAFRPLPRAPQALVTALTPLARLLPGFPSARRRYGVLSTDPAVDEAFDNDPLNYTGPVPLRTAVTMITQGAKTLENANMLRVPMLILHGQDDTLTDPNGSLEFLRRVTEAHPDADIELRLIKDSRHEILNEPNGHQLIPIIADWFLNHAAPAAQAARHHPVTHP